MDYLRPDVYVERNNTGEQPIQLLSSSTGALIGKSARGLAFKPVLVTSWSDYLRNFANGIESPFLKDDYLAYSVYGFFQNGGTRLYVVRVVDSNATKATGNLVGSAKENEATNIKFNAKDEGEWGNDLTVEVTSKVGLEGFDLIVKLKGTVVETFEVTNGFDSNYYYVEVINNNSNFITIDENAIDLVEGNVTFTGGKATNSAVVDNDYAKALSTLEFAQERISMIAIPGKSTDAIIQSIQKFADKNGVYPIYDVPFNTDVQGAVTFRQKFVGDNGSLYYPNIKVVDQSSKQGSLKLCPPSGHIMGVYARTDSARGVYKVPAGEEAVIKGAVALERDMLNEEVDVLNPIGVNCLIVKTNIGIVVWGARTISTNPNLRYVSDVRLDQLITDTAYNGTQWAVFEPNDEGLWERITASLKGMLHNLYQRGWFKGSSADEAYYIKCDGDLNTQESINRGEVIAEIGYAKKRPAEFVVIKIVQKSSEAK